MKSIALKTIVCSLLLLTFSFLAKAQQYDVKYPLCEGLSLFQLKGKYGFFDANDQVVIPCVFENANNFSDGLATVKKDGKTGFIDKSGTIVIPYQYEFAGNFFEGLVHVEVNGKFGYINKLGKMVIPAKYQDASYFSNGVAAVKLNGLWGCIDNTGSIIIPFKFDRIGTYQDGLMAVTDSDWKDGYIDIKGSVIIPLKYNSAHGFTEGLGFVKLNNKWGALNKQGRIVVPFEYDDLNAFAGGYALVKQNDKWGAVNKTGKLVVPAEYKYFDAREKKDAIASGKNSAISEVKKTVVTAEVVKTDAVKKEVTRNNSDIERPASKSVLIGKDEWMTENLNVAYFRNGEAIMHARNDEEWTYALRNSIAAWCYYNFDARNGDKYGRLYNFYAVRDKRGLAPKGWHVATQKEWKLITTGDKPAQALKNKSGWTLPEQETLKEDANGTNASGFTALPGGAKRPGGESAFGGWGPGFINVGEGGYWWIANDIDGPNAQSVAMNNYTFKAVMTYNIKNWGYSVRCVKD